MSDERPPPPSDFPSAPPVRPSDIHRVEFRHGSSAPPILKRLEAEPRSRQVVCLCQHVLRAEIEACIDEGAAGLEVISEKTGLGVGACGGVRCTFTCAKMVEDAQHGVPARELVRRFHASPQALKAALQVDGDAAANALLTQIERLRAFRASQK